MLDRNQEIPGSNPGRNWLSSVGPIGKALDYDTILSAHSLLPTNYDNVMNEPSHVYEATTIMTSLRLFLHSLELFLLTDSVQSLDFRGMTTHSHYGHIVVVPIKIITYRV